jgi:hypothetical protein
MKQNEFYEMWNEVPSGKTKRVVLIDKAILFADDYELFAIDVDLYRKGSRIANVPYDAIKDVN